MRKSKDEAAESRTRILDAAARLFRAYGPENVSVADVMRAAGMTHGGFYKHFASKEALLGETITVIFEEKRAQLSGATPSEARAALADYAEQYLSIVHVENRQFGCPIAGLSQDAVRAGAEAMNAMASGTIAMITQVAAAKGGGPAADEAALRDLIVMVGAIVLARSVKNPDTRERILATARTIRREG